MHTLTSSIFLPAYLHPLSPPLRRILLRTYLLDVLLTAEARGRPQINLELLMSRSAHPVGPAPTPEPKDTISDPRVVEGRNGWMALVESSLYAQGEFGCVCFYVICLPLAPFLDLYSWMCHQMVQRPTKAAGQVSTMTLALVLKPCCSEILPHSMLCYRISYPLDCPFDNHASDRRN